MFIFSYYFLRIYSTEWPGNAVELPDWQSALFAFAPLWIAGVLSFLLPRPTHRESKSLFNLGAAIFALSFLHLFLLYRQLAAHGLPVTESAYSSAFYILVFYDALLVLAGLMIYLIAIFSPKHLLDEDGPRALLHLEVGNMIWRFALVASLLIYFVCFISPHLLGRISP